MDFVLLARLLDDSGIINATSISNKARKLCKVGSKKEQEEVDNATDSNTDNNDDDDEHRKSHGITGTVGSEDEDYSCGDLASNIRLSMFHLLEDDLDGIIETGTRRPWRRQELSLVRNESATTIITSNIKSTVENYNKSIDEGIALSNDEYNNHDNNVNAMINNDCLEDSSQVPVYKSIRVVIFELIVTHATFLFLFVLPCMFFLMFSFIMSSLFLL